VILSVGFLQRQREYDIRHEYQSNFILFGWAMSGLIQSGPKDRSIVLSGFDDDYLSQVALALCKDYESVCSIMTQKTPISASFPNNMEVVSYNDLLQPAKISQSIQVKSAQYRAFQTTSDFYQCRYYYELTLNRQFLRRLTLYESEFYFQDLAAFYLALLQRMSCLDKVVFHATPHFAPDIILFFIARFLKVKTVTVQRTAITDCVVLNKDFRFGFCEPPFKLENQAKLDYAEFCRRCYDEGYPIKYSKSIVNRKTSFALNHLPTRIRNLPRFVRSWIRTNWYFTEQKFFFILSLRINRVYSRLRALRWLSVHGSVTALPEKFVFFPLHFRPERSTIPEANYFFDLASAITLLSQSLPTNFWIIVKEHPRQVGDGLIPDLRRTHFSELDLYNRIRRLPRVRFVPTSFPSRQLIERSSLVASCTGSALWEALQVGKPSLSFGNSWHSSCRSSPSVSSSADLSVQIGSLLNKTKADVLDDMNDFLLGIYPYTLAAAYSHEAATASDISYQSHVDSLVSAIANV
jgi:hypothetical protein